MSFTPSVFFFNPNCVNSCKICVVVARRTQAATTTATTITNKQNLHRQRTFIIISNSNSHGHQHFNTPTFCRLGCLLVEYDSATTFYIELFNTGGWCFMLVLIRWVKIIFMKIKNAQSHKLRYQKIVSIWPLNYCVKKEKKKKEKKRWTRHVTE